MLFGNLLYIAALGGGDGDCERQFGLHSRWCPTQGTCASSAFTCASPPSGCHRWFNGCETCDVVDLVPMCTSKRLCEASPKATECVSVDIPQEVIGRGLWSEHVDEDVSALRLRVTATQSGSDDVAYDIGLSLPFCMFLTAVYGSQRGEATLPAALQGSYVRPEFHDGQFASVGVDTEMWTAQQGLVVDDGAWFTVPDLDDGPGEWTERVNLMHIVLPKDRLATATFNVQLSTCWAHDFYHIIGLTAELWNRLRLHGAQPNGH